MTAPMSWQQIRGMAQRRRATPNTTLGGYTSQVDQTGADAASQGSQATGDYLSRAENFDASKALNSWAQGAYSNVSTALTQRLRDLTGQAVGAGRLNTGFFDEDQGQVIRGAQQDFSAALAQQSLGAASLQSQSDQALGRFGQAQQETGLDVAQSRREEMINTEREAQARARARKRGIGSLIGGVIGAAGGAIVGGPGGAKVGWGLGTAAGGGFG
jgi:hypothetical protein